MSEQSEQVEVVSEPELEPVLVQINNINIEIKNLDYQSDSSTESDSDIEENIKKEILQNEKKPNNNKFIKTAKLALLLKKR